MRKLFLFPVVLSGILMVLQSCSKPSAREAVAPMNSNTINATIALNGNYELPIDNSGNIGISMQAAHFQVSRTELDGESGFTIYKYVPAAGYSGTDEVVLSNTKAVVANSGECPHGGSSPATTYTTSYITVKINVTN